MSPDSATITVMALACSLVFLCDGLLLQLVQLIPPDSCEVKMVEQVSTGLEFDPSYSHTSRTSL
jgi:hypothetical protein